MSSEETASSCVWIVDDSPLDAEMARSVLGECYRVRVFLDAPEALAALTGGDPPDAMVLDWVMPDVTGVEVVQFLRQSPRLALQELKVLLLTGQNRAEQVAQGLEAGADDYLAKPYAPIELVARVGALLRSKALYARVRKAERTIRDLLAEAPDALVAVDREGHITWVNHEAERLVGAPVAELVERPLHEILPELDWRQVRHAGSVPDIVVREHFYSPSIRMVEDASLKGTVIALRDVTEKRHLMERRLDFYSMMAHDLRAPLQNMLLRSTLLARGRYGRLDDAVLLELQRVEESGQQLVSLLDDFLEIARFESLSHNLSRDPVDLCAVVDEVVQEYRPSVEGQGLSLLVRCSDSSVFVTGDPRRLRQVLVNLLTNAIKFTAAGGRISVKAWQEGSDAFLEVQDSGRGIPEDLKDTLFARYVRHHDGEDVRGTGLGLMIVREIVEAHGGVISVKSQLGKGSCFRVTIPVHATLAPS